MTLLQNSVSHFNTHGHVKIGSILNPELCQLLANYVRFKAKRRANRSLGGDPLPGVHREYGDPMMETLLEYLRPTVESATGLELYPTLSFCYHYERGNILKPHKDRECCEIVASFCFGADEEFKQNNNPWPLILKDRELVNVQYGDMLIFKGHETEHWRERFNGEWFVSAMFAYVAARGPYAYQKFDQRKSLGLPHVGMITWSLGVLKAKLLRFLATI